MRHLALLLALALAIGCSSAVDPPTRCTPGASVACVCPGVGVGAQVCEASGASYGACVCGADAGAEWDAPPDAPLDAATEDRPDVVGADLCVCPDVPAQADVVDAGPVRMCGDASVNLLEGTYLTSGPMGGTFTNCGACGRACSSAQRCTAGACGPRCPNGERAMCDGRMVSLVTGEQDGGLRHHCGACGITCAAGEVCDGCICAR